MFWRLCHIFCPWKDVSMYNKTMIHSKNTLGMGYVICLFPVRYKLWGPTWFYLRIWQHHRRVDEAKHPQWETHGRYTCSSNKPYTNPWKDPHIKICWDNKNQILKMSKGPFRILEWLSILSSTILTSCCRTTLRQLCSFERIPSQTKKYPWKFRQAPKNISPMVV